MNEEKKQEPMRDWLEHSRLLREKLMADRDRPTYHLLCPEDNGVPGDPNAAFYANGRYHLMFLYHCCSDGFRYGHLSSADLLHWIRHPDALIPDELDSGIFSGGAYVNEDNTVYITYWALNADPAHSGIRIAYSNDAQNHYSKWCKMDQEAVEATSNGCRTIQTANGSTLHLAAADPSNIWKSGDYYYFQAGCLTVMQQFGAENSRYEGDFTDLYRSRDLKSWDYVHRFYERRADNAWTQIGEDDMCPSFLPLPSSVDGGPVSGKWLQLFISHNMGAQYYIGQYDEEKELFFPESHGRMSWLDNSFFAPEALMAPDGRQLMWAWIKDNRREECDRFGWSGVFCLPRSLALAQDGTLAVEPAKELRALRVNPRNTPEGYHSRTCEINITMEMPDGTGRAGVRVFATANRTEETLIYYDAESHELVVDASRSFGDRPAIAERAPFFLDPGEKLNLTVFLDRSIVEVFANGRQAICRRVYTASETADEISIYSDGDISVDDIRIWDISPVNPY